MIRQEDVYRIGRIGRPHGVKGEVTFRFDDDVFDRVDSDYLVLSVDGILVPFFIEEYRFKSGEVALVKFCDIASVDDATSNILFELEDGRLVPAAADLIDGVDAEGQTITVRLPEGLLDL